MKYWPILALVLTACAWLSWQGLVWAGEKSESISTVKSDVVLVKKDLKELDEKVEKVEEVRETVQDLRNTTTKLEGKIEAITASQGRTEEQLDETEAKIDKAVQLLEQLANKPDPVVPVAAPVAPKPQIIYVPQQQRSYSNERAPIANHEKFPTRSYEYNAPGVRDWRNEPQQQYQMQAPSYYR